MPYRAELLSLGRQTGQKKTFNFFVLPSNHNSREIIEF